MKIALVIDDYLPSSTRVGAKMFHELAIELRDYGHEITVITPDYQQNVEFKVTDLDGIKVWRFNSGRIKDVSKLKRALNESLLSFKAWRAIKSQVKSSGFDGIIYYSPSIFWGWLVNRLKKKCCCPAYLVLRDLFPQWVIDAGMLKEKSLIARYFRFFEHYSYKQADQIGLMSEKNLELFRLQNNKYPSEVLRNWAKIYLACGTNISTSSMREKLNLQSKIIFFYGGNIGHAQDMGNLMRLVKSMQIHEYAHFLFVGQGDEVNLINSLAEKWQLNNYTYLPSVNQDEFKSLLAQVDVGLFSLSAQHTAHNFPGKLLGYMVESLPILGSVNIGNDLLDIVNSHHAGYIHINGEDVQLLKSAEKLYFDESLRRKIGENAKQLLINQFSVNSAAKHIERCLEAFNANT
jgi:glycosyltransferase involved in cell wall biosynthesis